MKLAPGERQISSLPKAIHKLFNLKEKLIFFFKSQNFRAEEVGVPSPLLSYRTPPYPTLLPVPRYSILPSRLSSPYLLYPMFP